MKTDAHTAGTVALMEVARSSLQALRVAVADLTIAPKEATAATLDQCKLLSKTADSLVKKVGLTSR